jgi:hypothetical protein
MRGYHMITDNCEYTAEGEYDMQVGWGAVVSLHTIKALRERRGITLLILNLSTRWQ